MQRLVTAGILVAVALGSAAERDLQCPAGTKVVEQAHEARCETPNGVSEGPFLGRNEDGTVRFRGSARRGKTHGAWTSWNANGTVAIEANYEDGELVGAFRRFDANGILQSEGNHDRDGAMDGTWTRYWPNGRVRTKWSMSHGAQQGPVTTWYETGAKKSEGQRAGGRPEGAWIYFDEDGRTTHQCRYEQGRVVAGNCDAPDLK